MYPSVHLPVYLSVYLSVSIYIRKALACGFLSAQSVFQIQPRLSIPPAQHSHTIPHQRIDGKDGCYDGFPGHSV